MAYYVGILDGKKHVWGVRIPDVPGCHGGGASPGEAIADAIQALRNFAGDGPLPPARSIDTVRDDSASEFDPAKECLVMLPLIAEQHQTVKANISMDAGRLAAIDAAARLQGMTRSAFLEGVALDAIARGVTSNVGFEDARTQESLSNPVRSIKSKTARKRRTPVLGSG
jgi:predicted RNase H-like HicB family nuclease